MLILSASHLQQATGPLLIHWSAMYTSFGLNSNSPNLLCIRAGIIRGESRAGDQNAAPNFCQQPEINGGVTIIGAYKHAFL
jgi:hypothetical protein